MEDASLSRRDVLQLLAGLGIAATAADVVAQDAAKMDPRAYKVVLENERVRVLGYVGKPRLGVCGEGMHSHPDHVTVVMTDARVKVTLPDGKTMVADNKAGTVLFEPAGSHAVENIGGRDVKSLLIEIKGAAKA